MHSHMPTYVHKDTHKMTFIYKLCMHAVLIHIICVTYYGNILYITCLAINVTHTAKLSEQFSYIHFLTFCNNLPSFTAHSL